MADRDFANEAVGDMPSRTRRRTGLVIILLFILFALAGSFGSGFWMGMQYNNKTAARPDTVSDKNTGKLKARLEMLESELRRYEQEAKEREAAIKNATAAVGDLTFYKDLPEQAVTPKPLTPPSRPKTGKPPAGTQKSDVSSIIRQELAAKPGPGKTRPAGKYLMQVGSFQRRSDAEELKNKLAVLKLHALIERSLVPGLGLWYRVHLGPYASREDAGPDKARVQSALHITGLIIKR